MPFEITTEDGGAKIATKYFGLLTTADIDAAYAQRFTDVEKIKRYRLIISDYTDVTETDLHDVDVESLAEMYKKASAYNPNVVAISINPSDFLFGLGRMWETYGFGMKWAHRVVRSREEAQAFIDEHGAASRPS